MEHGTVKWFSEEKGYGFIQADNGNEYFVHRSEIQEGNLLEKAQRVEFEIAQGKKGPEARKVSSLTATEE